MLPAVLGYGILSSIIIELPMEIPKWLTGARQDVAHKSLGSILWWPAIVWTLLALLRFLLALTTVVVERKGPVASLRRSWSLMRGNMLKAIGLSLVLLSPWAVCGLGAPILDILHLELSKTVGRLLGSAFGMLLTPVFVSALTLLYFDIRSRKEGFDNAALAAELDQDAGRCEESENSRE